MVGDDMGTGSMGTVASKSSSPITIYSYLVLVLFYMPCVTAMGVIAREGNKSWAAFSML